LPGKRNPQSAAEELAPPPQGESVLDSSMMAELSVTRKEIWPQLKKFTRNLAGLTEKSPARVVNDCRSREGMGPSIL